VLQYHADQRGGRVLNWSKLGFSGLSRRFKVREIEMKIKESGDHPFVMEKDLNNSRWSHVMMYQRCAL
jgi:hypothetical protein